jgi:hypothetical protein
MTKAIGVSPTAFDAVPVDRAPNWDYFWHSGSSGLFWHGHQEDVDALHPLAIAVFCLSAAAHSSESTPHPDWELCRPAYALGSASIVLRQHLQTEDRALLYATYFSLTNISLLFAYPLAGWIGATMGQKAGFMLLALGAGMAVLAALRLGRSAGASAQQKI